MYEAIDVLSATLQSSRNNINKNNKKAMVPNN